MLLRYKNRDYVLIQRKINRYGVTVQLGFLNGGKSFWVQEEKTKPAPQWKVQDVKTQ